MNNKSNSLEVPANDLMLLVEIGKLAHGYGITSSRLRDYLTQIADALGYDGTFRVTPSSLTLAISRKGSSVQILRFIHVPPPGFQMTRMAKLSEVMTRFEAKELTAEQTLEEIRLLEDIPDTYGQPLVCMAFGASAAGFAVLLNLSWHDVGISFLGGLISYIFVVLAKHSPFLAARLEFVSAFLVAIFVYGLSLVFPVEQSAKIILCGLLQLIPGYGLTVATAELGHGMVLSGFERLFGAIMTALKLFFGVVLAWFLMSTAFTLPDSVVGTPHPTIWLWAFTLVLALGLAVVFQVAVRDIPWILLAALVTYAGMVYGGSYGYWQGSFFGAAGLGIAANIYSRVSQRPGSIIRNTIVMILVPGAAALLGLRAGALSGGADGITAEWHAFINIVAILAGVVLSSLVLPPRRRYEIVSSCVRRP